MTVALILGTFLAVGALAFVLYPLFYAAPRARARIFAGVARSAGADDDVAIVALREIEFDRATGKLSDADYADLKDRYTRQALAVMRRREAAAVKVGEYRPPDDEIEAAVRAYRDAHAECPECGPRLEPDAVFCSTCGRYIPGVCPACGVSVDQPASRFCPACGVSLRA